MCLGPTDTNGKRSWEEKKITSSRRRGFQYCSFICIQLISEKHTHTCTSHTASYFLERISDSCRGCCPRRRNGSQREFLLKCKSVWRYDIVVRVAPYSPCLTITDRPPPPLSLLGPIVPIVPRFRLAIEDRQHSNKSYNWHPSDNGQKNPERLGQVAHQHSLKRLDSLPCNAHLYLHNPRFPFLGLIDLQIGAHQKKSDRKGPEDLLFHPLPIHFEQHFLLSFFPITFVCCSGRFVVCLFKRGIELATPFP